MRRFNDRSGVALCTVERAIRPCVGYERLQASKCSASQLVLAAKPVAFRCRQRAVPLEKPASARPWQTGRLSFALTRASKAVASFTIASLSRSPAPADRPSCLYIVAYRRDNIAIASASETARHRESCRQASVELQRRARKGAAEAHRRRRRTPVHKRARSSLTLARPTSGPEARPASRPSARAR